MPLHVQLLPTSLGDRTQTQSLTSFLINETIAIDAGSLGFSLTGPQLARVGHVILTHAHLDHVAGLPMAIAEVFPHLTRPMRVYATADVLQAVQDHLLNGVIWPDFSRIPLLNSDHPALEFVTLRHHGERLAVRGVEDLARGPGRGGPPLPVHLDRLLRWSSRHMPSPSLSDLHPQITQMCPTSAASTCPDGVEACAKVGRKCAASLWERDGKGMGMCAAGLGPLSPGDYSG